MTQTPDTNFAAYLVMLGHAFTHHVDGSTGKLRVIYTFDLEPEAYADLFTAYLNSETQRFVEAQRRLKNVIRLALH